MNKKTEKTQKNAQNRRVFEHTCYQTYFNTSQQRQKFVPLQHPKNNLFTLKKLILIEAKEAFVRIPLLIILSRQQILLLKTDRKS